MPVANFATATPALGRAALYARAAHWVAVQVRDALRDALRVLHSDARRAIFLWVPPFAVNGATSSFQILLHPSINVLQDPFRVLKIHAA